MYPFDYSPVWNVYKKDIVADSAALDVAEPLTFLTKLSAPLTEMNKNAVDALNTAIVTEVTRNHRCAETTSSQT